MEPTEQHVLTADDVIACLRSVTLERHVDAHTVIIHLSDHHRYEIYARIFEDMGTPVYLYDLVHSHPSYPEDFCIGVGTMQLSYFHEFGNAEKAFKPSQAFLQILAARMEPLKQWLRVHKESFPPFFKRYEEDEQHLVETITEPFSIHAEHVRWSR